MVVKREIRHNRVRRRRCWVITVRRRLVESADDTTRRRRGGVCVGGLSRRWRRVVVVVTGAGRRRRRRAVDGRRRGWRRRRRREILAAGIVASRAHCAFDLVLGAGGGAAVGDRNGRKCGREKEENRRERDEKFQRNGSFHLGEREDWKWSQFFFFFLREKNEEVK